MIKHPFMAAGVGQGHQCAYRDCGESCGRPDEHPIHRDPFGVPMAVTLVARAAPPSFVHARDAIGQLIWWHACGVIWRGTDTSEAHCWNGDAGPWFPLFREVQPPTLAEDLERIRGELARGDVAGHAALDRIEAALARSL